MVGVDVLKVPISCQGSQYILVIQDYFTKWPVAIPMKDQTANTIVQALVSTFSNYGIPSVLHSDQGTNFESTILTFPLVLFHIYVVLLFWLPISMVKDTVPLQLKFCTGWCLSV